jgi:hypothetical protein
MSPQWAYAHSTLDVICASPLLPSSLSMATWKCRCEANISVDILDEALEDLVGNGTLSDLVDDFTNGFAITGENSSLHGGSASVTMPVQLKLSLMCEDEECESAEEEQVVHIDVKARVDFDFTNRAAETGTCIWIIEQVTQSEASIVATDSAVSTELEDSLEEARENERQQMGWMREEGEREFEDRRGIPPVLFGGDECARS